MQWLLDRQLLDGSFAYKQPEFRQGMTALALYTLLKCGVRKDHPAVLRAVAFMDCQLPQKTYEAGLELMARGALDDPAQTPRMEEIVAKLLSWQVGGWSYPSGGADLSNTQYAAMGLRSAAQHGVKLPPEVWIKLGNEVLTHQPPAPGAYDPAGFGYAAKSNVYGSMTAAGVAVMRICVEQLEGVLKPPVAFTTAYKKGITWLGKHFTASANPLAGPEWLIYWLYSVERVGGICGIAELDGKDWYKEGAKYLVPKQTPQGTWDGLDGPAAHTCFALLFLARATSSVSGAVGRSPQLYGGDDPRQAVSLRASGDSPLAVWVSSLGEAEQVAYGWPPEQGGGLHVTGVDYVLPGRSLMKDAREEAGKWRCTFEAPPGGFELPDFDDADATNGPHWKSAAGAFGLLNSPGTSVRSEWKSDQLWLRRVFELDEQPLVDPQLVVHHGSGLPIRPGAVDASPLVCLFDEDPAFVNRLTEKNEGATVAIVEKDAANGRRCLSVTPLQAHSPALPGWNYPITEKPQPGEFRYLRFSWRKDGGGCVMLQFAVNGTWNGRTRRVVSGPNELNWPATQLEREAPKSWKTTTIDLWKEFGGNAVLTGISFTAKQGVGWFDALWLARSEADLKNIPKSGVLAAAAPAGEGEAAPADPAPASSATGQGPALEIWVNGTPVYAGNDEIAEYTAVATKTALAPLLHPGRNVLAVYCRRRGPGQSVDVGIADQRVLARIAGRDGAAAPGERWPAQVSFDKNGVYGIRARVHVKPPPAAGGSADEPEQVIESAPLAVTIREAADPELLSFAQDPGRNLVAQVGATVTASSFRDPNWSPQFAADNFQSRAWLSADGDPRPALAITLNKPVRADAILVSPLGAWVKAIDAGLAAPIRRVEIAIDGGKGGTFELVLPDDGRKAALRLPRPAVIRRLDLRVLDAEGGALRKNGVGLAEVELQLRK